jgi:hypothetical protein
MLDSASKHYYTSTVMKINEKEIEVNDVIYPNQFHHFFHKMPTVLFEEAVAVIELTSFDGLTGRNVSWNFPVNESITKNHSEIIRQLYAANLIKELEKTNHNNQNTAKIVQLSVKYHIMNDKTSFVVVDETKRDEIQSVPETVVVPQHTGSGDIYLLTGSSTGSLLLATGGTVGTRGIIEFTSGSESTSGSITFQTGAALDATEEHSFFASSSSFPTSDDIFIETGNGNDVLLAGGGSVRRTGGSFALATSGSSSTGAEIPQLSIDHERHSTGVFTGDLNSDSFFSSLPAGRGVSLFTGEIVQGNEGVTALEMTTTLGNNEQGNCLQIKSGENSERTFEILLKLKRVDGSFIRNPCSLHLLGESTTTHITEFSGYHDLTEEVVFQLFMLKKWKDRKERKFVMIVRNLESWFQGQDLKGKELKDWLQVVNDRYFANL